MCMMMESFKSVDPDHLYVISVVKNSNLDHVGFPACEEITNHCRSFLSHRHKEAAAAEM